MEGPLETRTPTESRAASPRDHQAAIRARLNQLRETHGQSELARRAGVPLTTIHRLLRKGKIPGEMLAMLTQSLGLNPAWMLSGEGPPRLADVPAAGAQMAGDLLALIDSMQAVSRMRLGALTGKPHQKLLRELLDSMQAYEILRDKLNGHSKPVLGKLVDEFEECLTRQNYARAAAIRAAAEQVSRLCDDEEIAIRFDSLRADMDYMQSKLDSSMEFQRRSFARHVLRGVFRDAAACDHAVMLVLLLKDCGRLREALRIGRAALALASDHGQDWPEYHDLRLFVGHVEVELGYLHEGFAKISEAYPMVRKPNNSGMTILMRSQMLSGMMALRDAAEFGTPNSGRSRVLLRHANLAEDLPLLDLMYKRSVGADVRTQLPPTEFEAGRARILMQALRRKGSSPYDDFIEHVNKNSLPLPSKFVRDFIGASTSAQVAWLCGQREECAKHVQEGWLLLQSPPPEITLTLDWTALFFRTALRLQQQRSTPLLAEACKRAREFFDSHVRKGYLFMVGFAPGA
ncbi:MAG: hypothetical protein IT462_10690 [Planctomycetes bacterium]|nr:hypothetical protein [Planctomycetota bacterium]